MKHCNPASCGNCKDMGIEEVGNYQEKYYCKNSSEEIEQLDPACSQYVGVGYE